MLDTGVEYEEDAQFIADLVRDYAITAKEISTSIEQVILTIESVATATEQGAVNSQKISTTVGETTTALSSVIQVAQNQNNLARDLEELLRKFDV